MPGTKRSISPEALIRLGLELRTLRKTPSSDYPQGRRLVDVAEYLGVSVPYLSQIEFGRTAISLRNLRLLAGLFDVPPARLLLHLGLIELDWLAAIFQDEPEDPLLNTTAEERAELVAYLRFIRFRAGVWSR